MTQRLYYNDSFLYDFHARVLDARELRREGNQSVWAVRLDRTAFYPTSGGQPFDTGPVATQSKSGVQLETAGDACFEDDDGEIWHRFSKIVPPDAEVRAPIIAERPRFR